ncbi:MAG: sensor histidine kinase, partial [Solirubrobacteraceae bacterium]|nr:sensor histidine kinase [Solirubrobacteraceae bacterium]
NAMLDRLERERRESARRALAAQEDERQRIARELHDQLGQTLTAITIQAERAAEQAEPASRELLDAIARSALHGVEDVRRITRELRPEALDDLGLVNALITLCTRIGAQSGVRVDRRLGGQQPELSPETELVVYRVAQESLTNAIRHAAPSVVAVELTPGPRGVRLLVRDDGLGMTGEALHQETSGLAGMRERAMLVGGTLTLRSEPGVGTEVELDVPVHQGEPSGAGGAGDADEPDAGDEVDEPGGRGDADEQGGRNPTRTPGAGRRAA